MLEQIKDDICQIVINNFMNIEGWEITNW
jgi:hypothetical protein